MEEQSKAKYRYMCLGMDQASSVDPSRRSSSKSRGCAPSLIKNCWQSLFNGRPTPCTSRTPNNRALAASRLLPSPPPAPAGSSSWKRKFWMRDFFFSAAVRLMTRDGPPCFPDTEVGSSRIAQLEMKSRVPELSRFLMYLGFWRRRGRGREEECVAKRDAQHPSTSKCAGVRSPVSSGRTAKLPDGRCFDVR